MLLGRLFLLRAPKLRLLALLLCSLLAGSASLAPLPRPALAQAPPLTRVGGLGGAFGAPVAGDGRAYLPEGPALAVIDTSDPTAPRRVGRVTLPERLTLHQRHGQLLLASAGKRLYLLDITERDAPAVRGVYNAPFAIHAVHAQGERAYLALLNGEVQAIGIADPAQPQLLGSYLSDSGLSDLAISGSTLYLAAGPQLRILDASNPAAMQLLGSYAPPPGGSFNSPGDVTSVALSGSTAYITVSYFVRLAGHVERLYAVDVANGAAPALRWTLNLDVTYVQPSRIVAAGAGRLVLTPALRVVDIRNPDEPLITAIGEHHYIGADLAHPFVYAADLDELHVLDLEDGAAPIPLGRLVVGALAQPVAIEVRGDTAFLLGWTAVTPFSALGSLQVIDISNRQGPRLIRTLNLPPGPSGTAPSALTLEGDRLYLAGYQQLHVIDLTQERAPALLGSFYEDPANPFSMMGASLDGAGERVYVASNESGLHILDVSAPESITLLGQYRGLATVNDVYADGLIAYVAAGGLGVVALDAANPAELTQLGSAMVPGQGRRLARDGDRLAVASDAGLSLLSIAEPGQPRVLGSAAFDRAEPNALDVAVAGTRAYVLAYSGIYVFEIANPAAPVLVGHYGQISSPTGLAAAGPTVALVDSLQGLALLGPPLPPQVWLPMLRR